MIVCYWSSCFVWFTFLVAYWMVAYLGLILGCLLLWLCICVKIDVMRVFVDLWLDWCDFYFNSSCEMYLIVCFYYYRLYGWWCCVLSCLLVIFGVLIFVVCCFGVCILDLGWLACLVRLDLIGLLLVGLCLDVCLFELVVICYWFIRFVWFMFIYWLVVCLRMIFNC